MPNRIHSLDVDFVSLVDRAAVRDAADSTQPQRFLLYKAEGDNREDILMADRPGDPAESTSSRQGVFVSPKAQAAIERAMGELEPERAEEPRVDALHSKLNEVAHPVSKTDTDDREDITMSENAEIETLGKHDDHRVREIIAKADEYVPGVAVALAKIQAAVVELRKADPSMTETAAKERVRTERPDLMRELARAERPVAA
jgi:hypothetical protein